MAKIRTLQIYRGTTAENESYTGAAGELTMDTTKNELRIHDGSTAGGHKIGAGYHPDLFDVKWADHILNDVQWLRADTFSWQAGSVYQAAYQHLTADITGKTLQSETIGGTTVQFYLADDGHKICPASEESNVAAIFAATGVAWYYILDTSNQRFKLPRTQFAFTGIRNGVGGFVEAGLPNITGNIESVAYTTQNNGALLIDSLGEYNQSGASASLRGAVQIRLDASNSNSIYGNSNTVQPKATEMYLHFYVGNFTQTALENTAGLNASLFNTKADIDLSNAALNASTSAKETIVGWGMPDYSAGVEKTRGVDFTVSQNSVLWITTDDFGTDSYLYINDVPYLIGGGAGFYSSCVQSSFVPVPTGTKIKVVFGRTYSGDRNKIICFPCIGG